MGAQSVLTPSLVLPASPCFPFPVSHHLLCPFFPSVLSATPAPPRLSGLCAVNPCWLGTRSAAQNLPVFQLGCSRPCTVITILALTREVLGRAVPAFRNTCLLLPFSVPALQKGQPSASPRWLWVTAAPGQEEQTHFTEPWGTGRG